MDGKERVDLCKQLACDKRRLGLPLGTIRSLDQSLRDEWQIAPPVPPDRWHAELARLAGADFHARFRYVNDRRTSFLQKGKPIPKETDARFYDLIADDRVSGHVHSQKRVFILDAAALLLYLIPRLGVTGSVLDVGCHVGYHAVLVGRETGREVVGIDPSTAAIQVARRKTPNGVNVRFDTTPLADDALTGLFELVYAVDSVNPTTENLKSLSRVLAPHGVLVLVHAFADLATNGFGRAVAAAGFGFGFADVTGGWQGEGRGYASTAVLVLLKGEREPIPGDLQQRIQEGWQPFSKYANDLGTPQDEKTQAFFRGHYLDQHP